MPYLPRTDLRQLYEIQTAQIMSSDGNFITKLSGKLCTLHGGKTACACLKRVIVWVLLFQNTGFKGSSKMGEFGELKKFLNFCNISQ